MVSAYGWCYGDGLQRRTSREIDTSSSTGWILANAGAIPTNRSPLLHMANRVRETQEKRRREQVKVARQASKEAERRERDAKKKADKLAGIVRPPEVCLSAAELEEMLEPPPVSKPPAAKPPMDKPPQ